MATDSVTQQRNETRPLMWATYCLLVAVAWLVNYLGRLNPDSVDMLTQARNIGELNDWHAPIVTWLWSLLDPIVGQPAGALLVQSVLMFVYPAFALPGRSYPNKVVNAALLIAWGVFLTALIAVTGQIWKDVVLVALVLCFLAVFERSSVKTRTKKPWLALGILLALIFLVRPTHFFMLAIVGVIWACFTVSGRTPRLKAIALVFAVCAASFFVSPLVNRVVIGAHNGMTERSLIIFDVAGVSTGIKQDLFEQLPDWPTGQVLKPWECYTATQWAPFMWGSCSRYSDLVKTVMQKKGAAFVTRWWIGNILQHPVAYLMHRLSSSYELIRHMSPIEIWGPPYAVNVADQIGDLRGTFAHGIDMTRSIQLWEPSIRYVPFGWTAAILFTRPAVGLALVFCGLSLFWAWRARLADREFDIVLVVSSAFGIANYLTLMLFGISNEGRYLLITFVCGVISLRRMIRFTSITRPAQLVGRVQSAEKL